MRAAEGGDGEHAYENGHGPSPGDDDPATSRALRLVEDDVGDDAVAEKDQKCRSDDFAEEGCHHVQVRVDEGGGIYATRSPSSIT